MLQIVKREKHETFCLQALGAKSRSPTFGNSLIYRSRQVRNKYAVPRRIKPRIVELEAKAT